MSLRAVADAIASAVEANTSIPAAFGVAPASFVSDCAVVVPAPEWGSYDGTTFCDSEIRWEIVLVKSGSDFASALDWFYDRLDELSAAFPDPTLGGLVDGCMVAGWQQPEVIVTGDSRALAVYVQLEPMRLTS